MKHAKSFYKSILLASIVITAICLFKLLFFYYQSETHATARAKQVTKDAAVMIEVKLKEVERDINSYAAACSVKSISDAETQKEFEKRIRANKALFGVVIAYAPRQFLPTEKLHSVYASWKNEEVDFSTVEKSYDYTDGMPSV